MLGFRLKPNLLKRFSFALLKIKVLLDAEEQFLPKITQFHTRVFVLEKNVLLIIKG